MSFLETHPETHVIDLTQLPVVIHEPLGKKEHQSLQALDVVESVRQHQEFRRLTLQARHLGMTALHSNSNY